MMLTPTNYVFIDWENMKLLAYSSNVNIEFARKEAQRLADREGVLVSAIGYDTQIDKRPCVAKPIGVFINQYKEGN